MPNVVAVAETRRDPDYPRIKLYKGDEDGGYVLVRKDNLERVEVTYKSTEIESVVSHAQPQPRFPSGFRAVIADATRRAARNGRSDNLDRET